MTCSGSHLYKFYRYEYIHYKSYLTHFSVANCRLFFIFFIKSIEFATYDTYLDIYVVSVCVHSKNKGYESRYDRSSYYPYSMK
jgi:hypothetical protein